MTKILQSTPRGQITLPKAWRDQFPTNYFSAEVKKGQFILTPVEVRKFEAEDEWEFTEETKKDIEIAWAEHKAGKSIPLAKVMKEYGL